jgi:hypothetical protein
MRQRKNSRVAVDLSVWALRSLARKNFEGDQRGKSNVAPSLLMLTMRILSSRDLWNSWIFTVSIEPMVLSLHLVTMPGEDKLIQGELMFESSVFQNRNDGTAEERLWRAVIARTLEEWVRGPLRYSRIAEEFLFHDNKDFLSVCSSAGMDPLRLRKKLEYIRTRAFQKQSGNSRSVASDSRRQGIPQSLVRVSS